MARYRGPVEKIERRFDVSLFLKGERRLAGKSAVERRHYGPGQHGQRRVKPSDYALQLHEKQKAKMLYGISERQFRSIFREASRREGNTGELLVTLLESRLDNVVYRMGFATTRRFARQLVTHGHVLVNGQKVNIPSALVAPGSKVEIKERPKPTLKSSGLLSSHTKQVLSRGLMWIKKRFLVSLHAFQNVKK